MIVEMSNVALPGMNNVPDNIVSLLGPEGRGQYGMTEQFWP